MNLQTRVERLEQCSGTAPEDCPLCSQPPREPVEVRAGFHVTSEHPLDLTCPHCGGPRRIIFCVYEPVGDEAEAAVF
jgi:hypothetical protein